MSPESVAFNAFELPTMTSSLDPISISPPITRGLTSARVAAVLKRRAKSLNFDDRNFPALDVFQEGEETRGRSTSRTRANVKRRRSIASASREASSSRVASRLRGRSNSRSRPENPTVPVHTRSSQSRNGATPRASSRGTNPTRRGTTLRSRSVRRATPYPNVVGSRKRSGVDGVGDIKESFNVTKNRADPLLAQLPLSGDVETHNSDGEATYEKKGAFRLKRNPANLEFRFPKSLSQPEPLWRAGDGFSSDEAKPNFIFSMTGAHKQKRPRPLPGIGKLQLEAEKMAKEDTSGRHAKRSKTRHLTEYDMERRRGAAKDIWPTVENFAEELVVRTRNPIVPDHENIIPSTISPEPTPVPQPRPLLEYVPPSSRKRKHSEFENFGRRLQAHGSMFADSPEPRGAHINQLDIGNDEEYDDEEKEEEYGMEEDEPVSETRYGGDDDEDEEYSSYDESVHGTACSQEPSSEDSAASGLEDASSEEAESYPADTQTADDSAQHGLRLIQALSE
ncbi:hypothetical protein Hte_004557 [Hypoxylon texense]